MSLKENAYREGCLCKQFLMSGLIGKKRIAGAGFESGGATPQVIDIATNSKSEKGQWTQIRTQAAVADNPDLSRIVEAWPNLPKHIQTAILTLVG